MKKYSFIGNLIYGLKQSWLVDKKIIIYTLINAPIIMLLPLCDTYFSKYVIQLLSEGAALIDLVICIFLFTIILMLLHFINNFVSTRIQWESSVNRFKFIGLCYKKTMEMDYQSFESNIGQIEMQKAFNAVSNNSSSTQQIFSQVINMSSNIIGLVTYSSILILLNPLVVIVFLLLSILNYLINNRNNLWFHRHKDKWVPIERKLSYIINKVGDFDAAKDIRLYNMSTWLRKKFQILLDERLEWSKRCELRGFRIDVISALSTLIKDGISYGFLIYMILQKNMSAADFVFYFGLFSQYSNWLFNVLSSYNTLKKISLDYTDLRTFLDKPILANYGEGVFIPTRSPHITFCDVSFRFENASNYFFERINIQINQGEKIALVGLNGAGKTTLIKLLCGFYRPTSGDININGHAIDEYNYNEYLTILSAVFQEINLLPTTIAQNIASCVESKINYDLLSKVLKLSGLYNKVANLPNKENTLLIKSIRDDATDLSGGEKQKLVLARALYKNGVIIILDEPTAALDSIAESELYKKYNDLTANATSIFVSHRLSSTRFCDRILFLENGKIVEEGTHDELMKLNGKYAKLFQIQSQYYSEDFSHDITK